MWVIGGQAASSDIDALEVSLLSADYCVCFVIPVDRFGKWMNVYRAGAMFQQRARNPVTDGVTPSLYRME